MHEMHILVYFQQRQNLNPPSGAVKTLLPAKILLHFPNRFDDRRVAICLLVSFWKNQK